MRRGAMVLVAMATMVACQPGTTGGVGTMQQPILGGTVDTGHPQVVEIVIGSGWSGQGLCTGTLVSPKVVLTAAHCVSNEDNAGYPQEVLFGASDSSAQSVQVAGYEAHPSYGPGYSGNYQVEFHDIGVVVLKTASSVTPAVYRTTTINGMAGQAVTFVGFGISQVGDQSSVGTKRKVTTTIGTIDAQGFWNYTTQSNPKNTCGGDSGGPGFVVSGGVEQIISVTSAGDEYCVSDGWNTRVDANASWIAQMIAKYDPTAATAVCGNGACESGETSSTCPADCSATATCGNGACESGETAATCPADCGGGTADIWGPCDSDFSCPGGQVCVGSDQSNPANDFCTVECATATDCPSGFTCEALQGGGAVCWSDGGTTAACGNGACESGESASTCPADCSGSTGDLMGPCDSDFSCPGDQVCVGDDQSNPANDFCTLECGSAADCPSGFTCEALQGGGGICWTDGGSTGGSCGDGLCAPDESASTCAADCHVGCNGLDDIGCCAGTVTTWCDPDSNEVKHLDCSTDGCGWDASQGWYDCGFTGADPSGAHPLECDGSISIPVCGDGACESGETAANCAADCSGTASPVCGNGTCESGETAANCAADCGGTASPVCGNGTCESGETAANCASDCGGTASPVCGNGTCEAGETEASCAADCDHATGAVCGDDTCDASEACDTCPADCGECPIISGDDTVDEGDTTDGAGRAGTGGASGCAATGHAAPGALLTVGLLLGLAVLRRRVA